MADSQPLHRPEKPQPRRKSNSCSGYPCCKLVVIIYALFFFLIGCLLFSIGVAIAVLKDEYGEINDLVTSPAILCLVVGIIIIVAALLGIIGALKEKLVLLRIFLAFIIIAFILQVIIGVLAFVYRERTAKIASKQLEFAVRNYHNNPRIASAVDKVQRKHNCCGLRSGAKDWDLNEIYSCSSTDELKCSVPDSCCIPEKEKEDCGKGVRNNPGAYNRKGIKNRGCSVEFLIFVEHHQDIVGAVALGFAIPQILGIFLVFTFIQKVEDRIYLFTYSKRMHQSESDS